MVAGGVWLPFPEGDWQGPVPVSDLDSEAYWRGLREHEVRLLRCQSCGHRIHQPLAMCPRCHSFDLRPEAVAGTGSVYSFTIAHREFVPGVRPPYAVALVEIDEEPSVRILTNLVSCRTDEVRIGLRVRAVFKDIDATTSLLFFEPDPGWP
jgi:uncharacterized protein